MRSTCEEFGVRNAQVRIFLTKQELGGVAARDAAEIVRRVVREKGSARVIIATGPSQDEVIDAFVQQDLPFGALELFHLDEYVGISSDHPASFRRWLKIRVVDQVHPGKVNYLDGEASNVDSECRRYGELLTAKPIDLCFLGIGENGHIAFNDPHEADFNDPKIVKRVRLDDRCKMQQVGEGHFKSISECPKQALTLTIPMLMKVDYIVCCVPDERKAGAVQASLEGPCSKQCPGSIVPDHRAATIYLDQGSASQLRDRHR